MSEAKEEKMNQEREQTKPKGITRRDFLKGAGAALAGVVAGFVLPDALTNKARIDAPAPDDRKHINLTSLL